jgi:hypothetical protein
MFRAFAVAAAVLCVSACTHATPSPASVRPSASPAMSAPPRVGQGIRLVLGGEPDLLSENTDVVAALSRLLQLTYDYYAYAAAPAPSQILGLLTEENKLEGSRWRTGGDTKSSQRQGPVIVAVVKIARTRSEVDVHYCEDYRHLLYYDVQNLESAPRPARIVIKPNLLGIRFVWTDARAADGSSSETPRWLASEPSEFRSEDPTCLAPLSRILVPPGAPRGAPLSGPM